MSEDVRRAILESVAAGRMDPSEAAEALADLDAERDNPPVGSSETPPPSDEPAESGFPDRFVAGIKIDGSFRSIEVIGDDSVREAVAEGPHRLRFEGDTLVVDGTFGGVDNDLDDYEDDDDDDNGRPGDWFRMRGPWVGHRGRGRGYGWDPRQHNSRPLRVRVNPDVPLEARVEAGPLTIRRVRGPIKARVAAGPLVIEGFESPIDVRVAAGKVSARGRLDSGVSTIDCDAGKVSVHLQRGSDVRVNAAATLGKVDFGGRGAGRTRRSRVADERDESDWGERIVGLLNNAFSDEHEITLGRGLGELDIRVSMGSADISFDDEPGL